MKKDQVLLDTRRKITEGFGAKASFAGNGLLIRILQSGVLEFIMDDGRSLLILCSEPGNIKEKSVNHLVINIDEKQSWLHFPGGIKYKIKAVSQITGKWFVIIKNTIGAY